MIKQTQIVSIDLIIKNKNNKYLLGKRKNNPAKGTLFTPGGRVFKNEQMRDGLKRILKDETGIIKFQQVKFLGVYDHIYDNNFRDNEFGTHYVSHAYIIYLTSQPDLKEMDDQHTEYYWLTRKQILENADCHIYVKNFFYDI